MIFIVNTFKETNYCRYNNFEEKEAMEFVFHIDNQKTPRLLFLWLEGVSMSKQKLW